VIDKHLLTADDHLRDRIGEQLRGEAGWLASYSNDDDFRRGTGTTRDDTGKGACETTYVKDFRVLRSMDNGWRTLMVVSGFIVLFTGLLWLVAVMRGVF
jgi:hypothetical protein